LSLDHCSKRFAQDFGMPVEMDSIKYYTLDDKADAYYLFHQLRLQHPKDSRFDAVLAFTGKKDMAIAGLSDSQEYCLVLDTAGEELTAQHELSHLFKAKDYDMDHPLFWDVSVMSYLWADLTDKWDWQNAGRMKQHLNRKWKHEEDGYDETRKYIAGFPKEQRQQLTTAFLSAGAKQHSPEAELLCKSLVDKYPDEDYIRLWYAQVLRQRKDDEACKKEYAEIAKRVTAAGTTHADLLNTIAWDYVDTWDTNYSEALALAKKGVELKPNDGAIVDTLGWAYYKTQQYGLAIKTLERAVALYPDDEIYSHLIAAYQKGGTLNQYINANEQRLKFDPFEGNAYIAYAKGMIDNAAGLNAAQKARTLEVAQRAVLLYPSSTEAQNVLEWAKALNGR
ncbi:tetratricopeptide repeat protein, partial [Candidatus Woesearchaeota archaeon]|nr:tetratricopeptide repeat protein [Candidatus Woesearchaeota archaeon]